MNAGPIAWFTGLPSSGKSTLAEQVAGALRSAGHPVVVLDGDAVRGALHPKPGYDDASRDAFYRTLAQLAALIAAQGSIVLVPATANLRAFRARARDLAPGPFLEVFLDASLEICRARDAKGLYAKAARGDAATAGALPGAGALYEPPLAADVVVTPGQTDAVDQVIMALLR